MHLKIKQTLPEVEHFFNQDSFDERLCSPSSYNGCPMALGGKTEFVDYQGSALDNPLSEIQTPILPELERFGVKGDSNRDV